MTPHVDALDRGHACYRQRAWLDAHQALSRAEEAVGLSAPDLELLAAAAFLVGRDDEGVRVMERAHHVHLKASDPVGAARCAIWAGFGLLDIGEPAHAIGWFGRAGRLLDRAGRDCAERGYLLIPDVFQRLDDDAEAARARSVSDELSEIADDYRSTVLLALAAHARGAVELSEGDARAALLVLRRACRLWQEMEAPYEVARVRVLVGLACRAQGDEDSTALELAAARVVYAQLGAAPDLARLDSLTRGPATAGSAGLTSRELQVLRLVAAGKSNRSIAADLVLSEKTVARHVSNILAKLGLPSRSAATAHAYQHGLV